MLFNSAQVTFSEESYRTLRLALFTCAILTLMLTWFLRKYLLNAPQGKRTTNSNHHPSYNFV